MTEQDRATKAEAEVERLKGELAEERWVVGSVMDSARRRGEEIERLKATRPMPSRDELAAIIFGAACRVGMMPETWEDVPELAREEFHDMADAVLTAIGGPPDPTSPGFAKALDLLGAYEGSEEPIEGSANKIVRVNSEDFAEIVAGVREATGVTPPVPAAIVERRWDTGRGIASEGHGFESESDAFLWASSGPRDECREVTRVPTWNVWHPATTAREGAR